MPQIKNLAVVVFKTAEQAEAARREAELADQVARWRAAARALPDGVVILEGERIAWCNDTAAAQFGIDIAQDTVEDIVCEEDAWRSSLRQRSNGRVPGPDPTSLG